MAARSVLILLGSGIVPRRLAGAIASPRSARTVPADCRQPSPKTTHFQERRSSRSSRSTASSATTATSPRAGSASTATRARRTPARTARTGARSSTSSRPARCRPRSKPQPTKDEKRVRHQLDREHAHEGRLHRPEGPRPRHDPAAQPRRVQQHHPRPVRRRLQAGRGLPGRRRRLRLRQHRRRALVPADPAGEVPGRGRQDPRRGAQDRRSRRRVRSRRYRPQNINVIPRSAKSREPVKIVFTTEGSAFLEKFNFPAEGEYVVRFRGVGHEGRRRVPEGGRPRGRQGRARRSPSTPSRASRRPTR